jgi:hypothetical protein
MLRALLELDYLVTVYPVGGVDPSETWESVYTDIPRNVECMVFGNYGIEGLGQFLNERKGYYSGVIISRPTTMNVLEHFSIKTRSSLAIFRSSMMQKRYSLHVSSDLQLFPESPSLTKSSFRRSERS